MTAINIIAGAYLMIVFPGNLNTVYVPMATSDVCEAERQKIIESLSIGTHATYCITSGYAR